GILPGVITRATLRRLATGTWRPPAGAGAADFTSDTAVLLGTYQSTRIIALALLEGAALLAAISYLLEGQAWTLGLALAALALMLSQFPTEARVRSWLQQQEDRLTDLRREAELGV